MVNNIRIQMFLCFLVLQLMGLGDSGFDDLSNRHRRNPFSGWKTEQCCLAALALGTMYSKKHVACVLFLHLHSLSGPLHSTLRCSSPLLQSLGLGRDLTSSFILRCTWLISLSLLFCWEHYSYTWRNVTLFWEMLLFKCGENVLICHLLELLPYSLQLQGLKIET